MRAAAAMPSQHELKKRASVHRRQVSARDRSGRSDVQPRQERRSSARRGSAGCGGGGRMTAAEVRSEKLEVRRPALRVFAAVLLTLVLAGGSSIKRDPPIQVWGDMKWQGKVKPQIPARLFP